MVPEIATVSLASSPDAPVGTLTMLARLRVPETVETALDLAILLGARGRHPGLGTTRDVWEALATIGAHDLAAVRAIEPHLDALSILDQAQRTEFPEWPDNSERTWGVFVAEGGDDPLLAVRRAEGWMLNGTKQWCSLAGTLDAALVSATAGDQRRLFAVNLHQPGIDVSALTWHARGLVEIPSPPVHFADVAAVAIGRPGWYLERQGRSWAGIGVAACWYGGSVGLARSLFASAAAHPSPFLLMHLGAVDALLQSSRRALAEAATLVDNGRAAGEEGRMLASRVRETVAENSAEVIDRVGRALGPAPLTLDDTHAKRVADLELYLRQHEAERDQASLGEALVGSGLAPW